MASVAEETAATHAEERLQNSDNARLQDSAEARPQVSAVDVEKGTAPNPKDSTEASDSIWAALWRYWWTHPLRVDSIMELQLLILTFSTGIQDAICFPDFQCFASNQTGNTVVLAVAAAGGGGDLFIPANIGTSLSAFLAGAIFTGQVGNLIGRRRRLWQFGNQMGQIFMTLGAAWIQYAHNDVVKGTWGRSALVLLASASGAQVAAARAMQIPEITTAMATAAWVDLVIDPQLLGWRNHSRDRRALFLVILVAGSFCGAFMHAKIGSPPALIVGGAIKILVAAALLVTKAERPPNHEADEGGKAGAVAMPG